MAGSKEVQENGTGQSGTGYARMAFYMKISAAVIALAAASVATVSAFGISDMASVAILAILGCAMAVLGYYISLDARKLLTTTVVTVIWQKKDTARSLATELSLSSRRYCMEYTDADGGRHSFCISRNGRFTSLGEGGTYEVLHRSDRPLGENNFLGYVMLSEPSGGGRGNRRENTRAAARRMEEETDRSGTKVYGKENDKDQGE